MSNVKFEHLFSPLQAMLSRLFAAVTDFDLLLAEIRSPLAPGLRITLSIGLAGYSPFQLDASQWLNAADQALYQAKSRGRDQVVMASEAEVVGDEERTPPGA